jgi:hypothetical protein
MMMTMRRFVMRIGLVATLLMPATALAGEIYGRIMEGTASVGEAATVTAKCGSKASAPVKCDKSGAYHLVVEESGKCALTVSYKSKSVSLDVVSYDEGVQVDIVLEMKDGQLTARRK